MIREFTVDYLQLDRGKLVARVYSVSNVSCVASVVSVACLASVTTLARVV